MLPARRSSRLRSFSQSKGLWKTIHYCLFNGSQSLRYSNFLYVVDALNELMLATVPATVLFFAILRLRLCILKGNASKLVTRRSVVLMYFSCIITSLVIEILLISPEFFLRTNLFLQDQLNYSYETSSDTCYKFVHSIHSTVLFYKWINITLCYIFPLLVSVFIYLKICIHIYKSTSRVQMHSFIPPQASPQNTLNFQQIRRSVVWIVLVMIACWVPLVYIKVEVLLSSESILPYMLKLYSALILFVIFPVEEGIMQMEKRKRLCEMFKWIFCKKQETNSRSIEECNDPDLSQNTVTTICSSLQESIETVEVRSINVNRTSLSEQAVTCDMVTRTTSIHSFSFSSSSSLFSRRCGCMVPSLKLSTTLQSERSSVIVSTSGSLSSREQLHISPYSSSCGSSFPLFVRVSRDPPSIVGQYSPDTVLETPSYIPNSLQTVSLSSSMSDENLRANM